MTAGPASASSEKVAFERSGAFIVATRRDVNDYLRSRSVRRRARFGLYLKGVAILAVWAASWGTLALARPGVGLGLLTLATLVGSMILIGFAIQHDANHGAYFTSRRLNRLLGWLTTDILLGFSSYVWRVKHNVAHHTYTNVDGYDDDVAQTPFARFLPSQPSRPWYRFQHIYVWPLYSLMVMRGQSSADVMALRRGRIGNVNLHPPRGWELAGLVAGKAIFLTWAFVVPLLVYPWWIVLVAYVGSTMLASLVIATTFQLAHCVEEADATSPADLAANRREWAAHEVETTVDFCTGNRVLTSLLGGLNFQIEHHLFPRLPHTHYPNIAPFVRRRAEEHGIRYTAQPSLRAALRSHHRQVRTLGRLGQPVELDMG
ncbi:MAG: fatty acid desaturase family protein [Gaiellaceae bacterium]